MATSKLNALKVETPEGMVALRPGAFLYIDGQTFQVITTPSSNSLILNVENLRTGHKEELSINSVLKPTKRDSIILIAANRDDLETQLIAKLPLQHAPVSEAGIPANFLEWADRIINTYLSIEKILTIKKGQAELNGFEFKLRQEIDEITRQKGIGHTTFYKYKKLYQKYGGNRARIARSLMHHYPTRISKAQYHFVDTIIMRYYARDNREKNIGKLRPSTVYRIAEEILLKRMQGKWPDPLKSRMEIPQDLITEILDPKIPVEGILNNVEKSSLLVPIQMPDRSWFYKYLRWFEDNPEKGRAAIIEREGEKFWEAHYLTFDTFVHRAAFPLQYTFTDHWLMDVFIVDEETRSQVTRLWLTVIIDAFTRCILGFSLNYEEPCIESIQSALLHAIWPKDSHHKYGIDKEYNCFGIGLFLFLDNAWAHHSHSLENLSRSISQNGQWPSITLVHRPPYRGRYGALIERFFLTASGKTKEFLEGAILSSNPRDVQNAAKRACLLYEDVDKFVHKLILDYMHTVHSELNGLTPHQKWMQSISSIPPAVPPLTENVERLFWRSLIGTRQKTTRGISVFGLTYNSDDIKQLPSVDPQNRRIEYGISYLPSDISKIAVFKDGKWVGDGCATELRQADGYYRPISLWERRIALDMTDNKGNRGNGDWLKFLEEMDELNDTRRREKKKAQRELLNTTKRKYRKYPSDLDIKEATEATLNAQSSDFDKLRTEALARFSE